MCTRVFILLRPFVGIHGWKSSHPANPPHAETFLEWKLNLVPGPRVWELVQELFKFVFCGEARISQNHYHIMTSLELSKNSWISAKKKGKFTWKTKLAKARYHQVRGRTPAKDTVNSEQSDHTWAPLGGLAPVASEVSGPRQNQSEDNMWRKPQGYMTISVLMEDSRELESKCIGHRYLHEPLDRHGHCLYNAWQKHTVISHALSQWGPCWCPAGDLLLLFILFSCVVYEQMRFQEAKEL